MSFWYTPDLPHTIGEFKCYTVEDPTNADFDQFEKEMIPSGAQVNLTRFLKGNQPPIYSIKFFEKSGIPDYYSILPVENTIWVFILFFS